MSSRILTLLAAVALVAACGDSDPLVSPTSSSPSTSSPSTSSPSSSVTTSEQQFPAVVAATAQQQPDGTWTFHATLSSPYDSAERYADAWRVRAPDGRVLAVRELLHDHASEQPFTRSLAGVTVPDEVDIVTIEGRDQHYGWGGSTVEVELAR